MEIVTSIYIGDLCTIWIFIPICVIRTFRIFAEIALHGEGEPRAPQHVLYFDGNAMGLLGGEYLGVIVIKESV